MSEQMEQRLPPWQSVLAVVAHPDDESFGLGAVLAAFATGGAEVSVLCFTHGEASTLHGVDGDLFDLRADELAAAAAELGLGRVSLLSHPDGALRSVDLDVLAADVLALADVCAPRGLVVFDVTGVTGHPDHVRATEAALAAADRMDVDVLAWTLPRSVATRLNDELGTAFAGLPEEQIDLRLQVERDRQSRAVQRHPSQAVPGSALWRRLELLGDVEHLRWLRRATV